MSKNLYARSTRYVGEDEDESLLRRMQLCGPCASVILLAEHPALLHPSIFHSCGNFNIIDRRQYHIRIHFRAATSLSLQPQLLDISALNEVFIGKRVIEKIGVLDFDLGSGAQERVLEEVSDF